MISRKGVTPAFSRPEERPTLPDPNHVRGRRSSYARRINTTRLTLLAAVLSVKGGAPAIVVVLHKGEVRYVFFEALRSEYFFTLAVCTILGSSFFSSGRLSAQVHSSSDTAGSGSQNPPPNDPTPITTQIIEVAPNAKVRVKLPTAITDQLKNRGRLEVDILNEQGESFIRPGAMCHLGKLPWGDLAGTCPGSREPQRSERLKSVKAFISELTATTYKGLSAELAAFKTRWHNTLESSGERYLILISDGAQISDGDASLGSLTILNPATVAQLTDARLGVPLPAKLTLALSPTCVLGDATGEPIGSLCPRSLPIPPIMATIDDAGSEVITLQATSTTGAVYVELAVRSTVDSGTTAPTAPFLSHKLHPTLH